MDAEYVLLKEASPTLIGLSMHYLDQQVISNDDSVLHLESCGRRSSLWKICSRIQTIKINILVIKCSSKCQNFHVLYAYQKFWK